MKETGTVFFHIRPLGYYMVLAKDAPKHTMVDDLLKEYWARQGTTFAFEKRKDGNWYGAYAFCGKNDQFNRRIGRMVAEGKLQCKRKDMAVLFGKEEPTFDDCIILRDLLDHDSHYARLELFYSDNDTVCEIIRSYNGASNLWSNGTSARKFLTGAKEVYA